jgi:hypothetical protein
VAVTVHLTQLSGAVSIRVMAREAVPEQHPTRAM